MQTSLLSYVFFYRSGVEESYSEKNQLLQEISDLKKEYEIPKNKSLYRDKQRLGIQARNTALQNMCREITVSKSQKLTSFI